MPIDIIRSSGYEQNALKNNYRQKGCLLDELKQSILQQAFKGELTEVSA